MSGRPSTAINARRLKVTWAVEFENYGGDMPGPEDEGFSDFLVEVLMESAPNIGSLIYGDDDDPADLQPIGWSLDVGEYGDMQIGTLMERPDENGSQATGAQP